MAQNLMDTTLGDPGYAQRSPPDDLPPFPREPDHEILARSGEAVLPDVNVGATIPD